MPVETPSLFSRVIQEHLELKRRNAALDDDMPLAGYMVDDPFSNHPLFKSEEQARLEETMDGQSVGDMTMLLDPPGHGEDTAEHTVLNVALPDPAAALSATPAAPAAPAEPALSPAQAALAEARAAEPDAASATVAAIALPGEPDEASAEAAAPVAPAPGMLPNALPADETSWGRSRDFDWGD